MQNIERLDLFVAANNYANLILPKIIEKYGQPGKDIVVSTLQGYCQALTDAKTLTLFISTTEEKKEEREIKQELSDETEMAALEQVQQEPAEIEQQEEEEEDLIDSDVEFIEDEKPKLPDSVERVREEAAKKTQELRQAEKELAEKNETSESRIPMKAPEIKRPSFLDRLKASR